jgi:small subunit ribosomal protein S20
MANTKSARKATRVIARRTEVNKARRTLLRNSMRKVEEAIQSGDRNAALAAFKTTEPVIMRAAQRGVVHKSNAAGKFRRLAHRIAKLGKCVGDISTTRFCSEFVSRYPAEKSCIKTRAAPDVRWSAGVSM